MTRRRQEKTVIQRRAMRGPWVRTPPVRPLLAIACLAFLVAARPGVAQEVATAAAFEPTIESLKQYQCPEWFRDAKLGVYLHWGVYSVAEFGEWYPRRMYEEGTEQYKHHLATYGHPSEFGYKDFVPLWKAERWDPDALVALFKRAGARYFSPCAVHHDNFDLWDSKHQPWNSVNMGPKKDIIGIWRESAKRAGLRFGVTTHLSRSYSWFNTANQADAEGPKKGVPYDGAQGRGEGLYPPNDGQSTNRSAPYDAPAAWREHWKDRITQLIDDYQPDCLYFDCSVPFRGPDRGKTGMEVIAHFYNRRPEGVMFVKARPWHGLYEAGMTTMDYERGKATHILAEPWQTDDSIGPWGYNRFWPSYTTTDQQIDKFIDIVSKNGCLLLNIPIRADGTLDETATRILEEMGEWIAVNGEGIYGTRPWYTFGEGKINQLATKAIDSPFTSEDVRFTRKGDDVYAFVMDWPTDEPVVIETMSTSNFTRVKKIESVELLGYDEAIPWEHHADGLRVDFPAVKPAGLDFAYCLKIRLVE